MKAQYTPGPWFIGDQGDIRCPYPNHAPGISIAHVTCFGAHDVHLAKGANALLLSCAPKLLEALENLLACVNVRIDDPRIGQFDAARAIVAKAKGGGQ